MLNWKSHRSHLRAHCSSQANIATIYCKRYNARACALYAATIDGFVEAPAFPWISNRPPLRAHFSSQANMVTFLLWTTQTRGRARARARARLRVARCGKRRVR